MWDLGIPEFLCGILIDNGTMTYLLVAFDDFHKLWYTLREVFMYAFPVGVKFFITNSWLLLEEESDLEVFFSSWHDDENEGFDSIRSDF
jgi:hypothetical protein